MTPLLNSLSALNYDCWRTAARSLPAPLNASQAARFQAVLVDYKNVLENIATAISHATDAAVDLQVVGEHNEAEYEYLSVI